MRIGKRLLASAATVALATGLVAVAAAPAAHATALPKHDASNDQVQCNDILGRIKFSVPLTLGGTTPNQVTLTIKSDDCTDLTSGVYDAGTNPNGISIKSGTAKGILNSSTNDCLGLQGLSTSTSGNVIASWAMNKATPALLNNTNPAKGPLVSNKTTLGVTQTWGGTYNDGGETSPSTASDSWGATYGFFAIGSSTSGLPIGTNPTGNPPPNDHQHYTTAPTISGAFTGGDSGAKTEFQGATTQTTGALGYECLVLGAVKGITFSIGGFTFK